MDIELDMQKPEIILIEDQMNLDTNALVVDVSCVWGGRGVGWGVEGEATSASRTLWWMRRILRSPTHLYKDKMNLDTSYLVVAV